MRIVIFLIEEVNVIRRDHADIELFTKLKHTLYDLYLTLIKIAEIIARLKRNIIAKFSRLMKHYL